MGVSFLKSNEYSDNEKDKNDIINENINGIHHNDNIYKECSYPKCTSKKALSKHAQISQFPVHKSLMSERYDRFSWTKIYRSPVPRRLCHDKLQLDEPTSNTNVLSDLSPISNDKEDDANVIKITAQTSAISFVSPKRKKPMCSKILPKLMCPCCSGGDDCVEESRTPYINKSAKSNSYETIDLKPNSANDFSLNIDASLMSMIYLQRNSKHKMAESYAKMIKTVLRNTWKQFLYAFLFKRNHGPSKTTSELINSTLLNE